MNTLTDAVHDYVGHAAKLGVRLVQVEGWLKALRHLHGYPRKNPGDHRVGLTVGRKTVW